MSFPHTPAFCQDTYFGTTFFNQHSGLCLNPTMTRKQVLQACAGQRPDIYGVDGVLPGTKGLGCLVRGQQGKVGSAGLSCQVQHPQDPDVSVWC